MVRLGCSFLLFGMLAPNHVSGAAADIRQHVLYNPDNVEVTEIHMVLSSHFDAGCKTPACGELAEGEPDLCAFVGATNAHGATDPTGTGEPYNYHIINRYFDEFLTKAVDFAEENRDSDTPYTYMTQSWVLAQFFDCEDSGVFSWPGSGWESESSVLHCPNASAKAKVKASLQRGDIFMHAFPHDGEASYYPDASLFEAALKVTMDLADAWGVPHPTSVSQRDVPGWTRATLPLLKKHGINGLSFGAGTPPGKPDVPPICVWRDESSDSEVVMTYETGYGNTHTVFVLPNGAALAVAWQGDNTGPAPPKDVNGFYAYLREQFPSAKVHASTLDAFFNAANRPEVKSRLPVVTQEIGDGWLYGVPSDPLKNAQFREVSRQRLACIQSGACEPSDPAMVRADRLLVKVPEHTWGVALGWFLPDHVNYTNDQFDKARAQQPLGFVKNNTVHADYNTTVNSWNEQRTYVTAYPAIWGKSYPELAKTLSEALGALEKVDSPSTEGMTLVSQPEVSQFDCGKFLVGFNAHAGVSMLRDVASGFDWANSSKVLGQFWYESYTNEDYNIFLHDFAARLGDEGVWPEHSPIPDHGSCHYNNGSADDLGCQNFRKPNVSSGQPQRRDLTPAMRELWVSKDAKGSSCRFVAFSDMPEEASRMAGAPKRVATSVTISESILDIEVLQLDKRPTRFPEATFVTFDPAVNDKEAWHVRILNHTMRIDDTLGHVGQKATGEDWVFGGSPHQRGVEEVSYHGPESSAIFSSLDVPIACLGLRSPFPTPRAEEPDMSHGLHWNIFNNIWNTNYVLWYPYLPEDKNIRSRFRMVVHDEVASIWT